MAMFLSLYHSLSSPRKLEDIEGRLLLSSKHETQGSINSAQNQGRILELLEGVGETIFDYLVRSQS